MDALDALRRKFPDKPKSWLKRALARVGDVEERGDFYVVRGRPDLGDRYPAYHVWWSEAERRWYCTCYLTEWGQRRAREICTHVAAVMLYRAHKALVESAARRRVYVVSAVVECSSKPSANGEVRAKPIPGKTLLDYSRPRWRVVAISESPVVEIYCEGRLALKAPGEEMDYAAARVLAEEA